MLCIDGKMTTISYIDQYYAHMSKLRDSVNYLKSLIPMAKEIINEDILSNLDPNEFLNLYQIDFNYNATALISQILEFLYELNQETKNLMDQYTIGIIAPIKNVFTKLINIEGLNEVIEIIAKNIFIDPKDYQNRLKALVVGHCGIINNIPYYFDQEIIYHQEKSKGRYFFNATAYDQDYRKLKDEIRLKYIEDREKFLNDNQEETKIYVPEQLMNELFKVIDNAIDEAYELIIEIV